VSPVHGTFGLSFEGPGMQHEKHDIFLKELLSALSDILFMHFTVIGDLPDQIFGTLTPDFLFRSLAVKDLKVAGHDALQFVYKF